MIEMEDGAWYICWGCDDEFMFEDGECNHDCIVHGGAVCNECAKSCGCGMQCDDEEDKTTSDVEVTSSEEIKSAEEPIDVA